MASVDAVDARVCIQLFIVITEHASLHTSVQWFPMRQDLDLCVSRTEATITRLQVET
jgi:hypothetical protein